MSFRCQKCNKVSQLYEKQHTIIIKKRDKSYHYYVVKVKGNYGKNKIRYTEIKPNEKDKNKQIIKEFNSKGWEIKKEIKVCKECANV